MNKNIELYKKYFVDNSFERLSLFEQLRDIYGIESAIYLGSFVHITPAFIFPKTAFIDSDRRMAKFFEDEEVAEFIEAKSQYDQKPEIFFAQQNYENKLPLEHESYDLLISQYAGFVSRAGKKFLKAGGILVANNSHGDAAMAFLDDDFEFIGVANHTKDKWRISSDDLEEYFIPKNGEHPNAAEVRESMKGIGYLRSASNYIFRKST